jgi:hypothetical protein
MSLKRWYGVSSEQVTATSGQPVKPDRDRRRIPLMPRRDRYVRMLDFKDPRGYSYAEVDLDLLIPDPENPRIPIQESSLETVLALVRHDPDGLFNLARDVVKMRGTNPAELLNVKPFGGSFVVKEGNRRVAARKILRNPEQLRGHVSDAELDRWTRLSRLDNARKLPVTALAVIGEDHEAWVDRRHLGPQGGVGVAQWNPQAKARREARRRGVKDRALVLIDSLKVTYPDRFGPLEPPHRTFTTFTRVLDSQEARAHIGIDVDAQGNVVLTQGERSLRLIEEILLDLRKSGREKLTSRRIHTTAQTMEYLGEAEGRINTEVEETPITLVSLASNTSSGQKKPGYSRTKNSDVLKSLTAPTVPRLRKIYDELSKVKKVGAQNAAMVLTRVLLELAVDNYANANNLAFAGDKNNELELELQAFQKIISAASITPSKLIRDALKWASNRPMNLSKKLEYVIRDLIKRGFINTKEGNAKIRELNANDVIALLNDSVHRLDNAPSMDRVDHILEVVRPIFNAMNAS